MEAKTASPPRWVWWLLGCSFVGGFLLFCGCGVLGFWGYRLFQQHALPRLTWEQVQQLVPDLPVYPNAQFSEQLTNFPLYRLMPKMSAELKDRGERLLLIAFRTSDPPSKVLEWYRRTLVQQGWWEEETRELAQAHPLLQKTVNPFRRRFWKGNSLLMFRALDAHHFVLGCSLPGLFPWEMKELEEQVQRQPQDGEAWAQLAWGYLCIAQWDKAREAALKAASHPPEKVSLKALLAETLLELDEPEKALPLFKEVVLSAEKLPTRMRVHWQLLYIACLAGTKQFAEAEKALTRAMASWPKAWQIHACALRSLLRWKLGRREEAVKDMAVAFERDSGWWQILVHQYWQLGRKDEAWAVVRKVADKDPFARLLLSRRQKTPWLGIYSGEAPRWMSGRWIAHSKVKGAWCVRPLLSPRSRNFTALDKTLIFAVNGKTFASSGQFQRVLYNLCVNARIGDTATVSLWRKGKFEQVTVRFEPFLLQHESRRD